MLLVSSLAFAATLGNFDRAAAQTYPTRPVTMVVTFAAGGGDDLLARNIAPRLSQVGLSGDRKCQTGVAGMDRRSSREAAPRSPVRSRRHRILRRNQRSTNIALYNAVSDSVPVVPVADSLFCSIARKDPASNAENHCLFQDERVQVAVWLARSRFDIPSRLRAAKCSRGDPCRTYPLSRQEPQRISIHCSPEFDYYVLIVRLRRL